MGPSTIRHISITSLLPLLVSTLYPSYNKQTKLDCVSGSSRGFIATNLAEARFIEGDTTAQSISVYPLAKMGDYLQSVDRIQASRHPSCGSHRNRGATTVQSISVYPLAKMGDDLQSVDEFPASKHPKKWHEW